MTETDESLSVGTVFAGRHERRPGDQRPLRANGPALQKADPVITPSRYMFEQIDIAPVRVQDRFWSGSK
jgi:hypothetical protein